MIDYSRLALAYFEAGELVSARRNANNALALDDGAAASLEVLALISQREQDYSLAKEYFRLALRKAPRSLRIRNNFTAFLFEQARYSEAYIERQRVVADTGYAGRTEAYENFGLTSLELKNTVEASEVFLRATHLEPSLVQSSLELCILSIQRGEWPEGGCGSSAISMRGATQALQKPLHIAIEHCRQDTISPVNQAMRMQQRPRSVYLIPEMRQLT